jgi:hypothetical protein
MRSRQSSTDVKFPRFRNRRTKMLNQSSIWFSQLVCFGVYITPLLYFSEYQVNYHLAMAVCCLANKVAKRSTACCPR